MTPDPSRQDALEQQNGIAPRLPQRAYDLTPPNLDDRTFQQLVDEAKGRIPHYTPKWTDHNVSDPGVTLIELFAGMVDTLIERLNRVTERQYAAFMNFIGLRLEPPTAATVDLIFRLAAPSETSVKIEANTQVETDEISDREPERFSTNATFFVTRPEPLELVTGAETPQDEPERRPLQLHNSALIDDKTPFEAFGSVPNAGDYFALVCRNDLSRHILEFSLEFAPVEGLGIREDNPPIAWEAYCGTWVRADVWRFDISMGLLRQEWWPSDSTRGLNQNGKIVVILPGGMRPLTQTVAEGKGTREVTGYWVRCRHRTPRPPDMPAYVRTPRIRKLSVAAVGGVVPATHSTAVFGEVLGRSNGEPGQVFRLEQRPVLRFPKSETNPDERVVEVYDPKSEKWEAWEERADFGGSRASSPHYVIDEVRGEVCFGPRVRAPDGRSIQYGAIPPRDHIIRIRRYSYGGGQINVEPHKITILRASVPKVDGVTNMRPVTGGLDAERPEHARMRVPEALRSGETVVTAPDYERFARQIAGVHAARCLQPGERKAGDKPGATPPVRLLVVPSATPDAEGRLELRQLTLSSALKTTIEEAFRPRRVVTVPLDVQPARYRRVAIHATLVAKAAAKDALQRAALGVLFRYLSPISGGRSGAGWPFGEPLSIGEIYTLLQTLPGLAYIENVELREDDGRVVFVVPLADEEVILSGNHDITVNEEAR
jgi:hypothetical protein